MVSEVSSNRIGLVGDHLLGRCQKVATSTTFARPSIDGIAAICRAMGGTSNRAGRSRMGITCRGLGRSPCRMTGRRMVMQRRCGEVIKSLGRGSILGYDRQMYRLVYHSPCPTRTVVCHVA